MAQENYETPAIKNQLLLKYSMMYVTIRCETSSALVKKTDNYGEFWDFYEIVFKFFNSYFPFSAFSETLIFSEC